MTDISLNELSKKISNLLVEARKRVLQTVNHTMVLTYFEIGRMIVEEEQNGKERADYGKQLLSDLSQTLTKEFWQRFFCYQSATNETVLYCLLKTADTVC